MEKTQHVFFDSAKLEKQAQKRFFGILRMALRAARRPSAVPVAFKTLKMSYMALWPCWCRFGKKVPIS